MGRINYTDVIRELHKETGYGAKDLKEVMEAVDAVTLRHLQNGESLKITPNITIAAVDVPEQNKFNVRTKDVRPVPAHRIAKLVLTNSFKNIFR